MLRTADLIEKHNDEIATLETWDNGKPYEQARDVEIPMLVRLIRYYAGMCSVECGTEPFFYLFGGNNTNACIFIFSRLG